MNHIKKLCGLLSVVLVLTGCSQKQEKTDESDKKTATVIQGAKGEYSIITPYESSPLRQEYGINFREVDMLEIGKRLQDKSKDVFSPSQYNISEGRIINEDHYGQLLRRESENYPYGLNPPTGTSITSEKDKKKITDPTLISDIVEVDFHTTTDISKTNAVSVALVLKRVQTEDGTGFPVMLTDDELYEYARTSIGTKFVSYFRTIEGMSDVPLYVALYVQESDVDNLPGKYLPGKYIGHGYFENRGGQFERDKEGWVLLNTPDASNGYPQTSSDFSVFKKEIADFMHDENVGVVGKIFVDDGTIQRLDLDVTTGGKTYTELNGLAQYTMQIIDKFSDVNGPITVNIKIFQNTRIVIQKQPGNNKPTMITIT